MRRTKLTVCKFADANRAAVAGALVLTACFAVPLLAQQRGQKTFASPQVASSALFTAIKGNDHKAVMDILGPDATQLVSSGDEAEDAQSRATFIQKYEQMHRLVKEPDGTTTLYIGAENWPTPIPLVNSGHGWYFDTAAGKHEILYRRVGRNELSAIRICQELVAAQKEYHAARHNQYCPKILSDQGQHNGLYWQPSQGQPQSAVGPLVAMAVSVRMNGQAPKSPATPFRGYYFRLLTRQGASAAGGPENYMVNGKLSRGFAFVAYPAEYRSSGVMTFIANQDGVVFQKDLGPHTEGIAKAMKEYNPDPSWQRADEPEQTASNQ